MRQNQSDGIVVLNNAMISGAQIGAVEELRLWHLLPGTPVLAIGGWGYAFPTDQQRGQYAEIPSDLQKQRLLEPERAAQFALDRLCRGVVWAFGDPSVSHEYVLDLMQVSRAASRYTAIITSGFLTMAALDQLGHYLDGMNLELRAFDDKAYARLSGVKVWRGILEVAVHAQKRWGVHVEITTRLHPGVNDNHEQLTALATWIREALGSNTPWHILPGDVGSAASATVNRARRIARDAGLQFVYGPDLTQSTVCPVCSNIMIDRSSRPVRVVGLNQGRCAHCDTDLQIRTSIFKR
jgi:pyruvate formate lyase activating enzyme